MTNTKLREEVLAFVDEQCPLDKYMDELLEVDKFGYRCATSPDSPLLKKALELLTMALSRLDSHAIDCEDLVGKQSEICEVQESFK